MYIDFSQTEETVFKAEVCIIGSGAAGFACAMTLLHSGIQVLIVEGGLQTFNAQAADLHRGELTGHPHSGIHEARERIIGGTTTKWGGQAFPFLSEDFEKRPYVNLSGWPLSYTDMEPYYRKAEQILGTDGSVPFAYRPWKDWHIREPEFFSSRIDLFVTKWCKIPNFSIQHGHKVEHSSNVTLLRNANIVELLPAVHQNAVQSMRIRSLDGKQGLVEAKYIIAAGGALETVRLFLSSKKFGEPGIGNEHVGCYFQDHVAAVAGQIFPHSRKGFQDVFDPFYKRGFKYFPRIKINPSLAKELEILHTSAQVVFSEDESSILGNMKEMVSALRNKKIPDTKLVKKIANPLRIKEAARAGIRWKLTRRGISPSQGPIWLEIHSEQEPDCKSSATLSSEADKLGMPRIRLNWTISDLTIRTIRTMALLIKTEFERTSFARVVLEPWVQNPGVDPRRWLGDVFHQAGGLRMANTKEEGVVDADCKVFGIDNLYVASSAVFPTSSFSNPTMTIIALSIKIAETVERRSKEDARAPASL